MTPLANKLSTYALVVSVLATTATPLFAMALDPVCAAKPHDCGQTTSIVKCCCADEATASSQAGPVESRVQLNASLTPAPGAFGTAALPDLPRLPARLYTSPPRGGPVDLPTLFASLLI